jgi:WD40 repeat protein
LASGAGVHSSPYDQNWFTAKIWRLSSDNSSATCVATLNHQSLVAGVAFLPHILPPFLATVTGGGEWGGYKYPQLLRVWKLSYDGSTATSIGSPNCAFVYNSNLAQHKTTCFHYLGGMESVRYFIFDKKSTLNTFNIAVIFCNVYNAEDCWSKVFVLALSDSAGSMTEAFRVSGYSVTFHPTLPLLVTGGHLYTQFYRASSDLTQMIPLVTLYGLNNDNNHMDFHSKFHILATGSSDNTVNLRL